MINKNHEVEQKEYEYNDTPEWQSISCRECDTVMGYNRELERFQCGCCGKEVDEADAEEYYDDDIPSGCAACGGPYPNCMTSCKMFDD